MMRRATCLLLLVAALSSSLWADPPSEDSIRRNLHQLKGRIKASQAQLDEANNKEKVLSAQLGATQRELESASQQLREVKTRLSVAQTRLELLVRSVRLTEAKLKKAQRALERRMRSIYEEGETNYLAVLLESTSFTDFINQTEYLQRIIQTDTDLIAEVRATKAELERQREAAQRTVIEIKALKKEFEQRVDALENLQNKQAGLLAEIRTERSRLERYVDGLEHLSADMEAQLEQIIRERSSPPGAVPASAGGYLRPVNGPVLSPFGYRVHPITGTTRFHSGLDFGVDYGTPIRAADHGVVIYAGWYGGYGNCVIIQHGGSFSTLYGHCQQLYVTQGQQVRQGQTIAAVGSTGMSTGPHLHFEVRQNGTPVDPMGRL